MAKDLLEANYSVIVLDNLSTGNREMLTRLLLIEGNFGDARLLDKIFSDHQIDTVMHFAAHALRGEAVENPLEYRVNKVARTFVPGPHVEIVDVVAHGIGALCFPLVFHLRTLYKSSRSQMRKRYDIAASSKSPSNLC